MWAESVRRARHMRALFPDRYLLVRFEDLVRDPDRRRAANSVPDLGIPFEEKMLDRTVVSEGFRAGSRGFDAQADRRWENHISAAAARWYRLVLADPLRAWGYEP